MPAPQAPKCAPDKTAFLTLAPALFVVLWATGYIGARMGAITKVASLLFMVPPITAIMGYVLFGEVLSGFQIFGMVLSAGGVGLASSNPLKKN